MPKMQVGVLGHTEKKEAVVYIYVLKDPSGVVRYVGKATNVTTRLRSHICESKNPKHAHTRKNRWLSKLMDDGKLPVLEVVESVIVSKWEESERHWIVHFKSLGCDLTNLTEGGDGVSGIKWSAATKKKWSKMRKGHKVSEETRRKLSEVFKGKKLNHETGDQISKRQKRFWSKLSVKKKRDLMRGITDEIRSLNGKKSKGRKMALEVKAKMPDAIRRGWVGLTQEQRQKRLAGLKKRWPKDSEIVRKS